MKQIQFFLRFALICASLLVLANANAANLFANVSKSGVLNSGSGAIGVAYLGSGRYEVTFNQNVSSCAYVASTAKSNTQALTVFTASGHNGVNGVYVETKNQGGGLSDAPFSLVVDCGAPGMPYAVVGYSSNLVRATPGTVLTDLGTGRYNVSFPVNVSGCAFIATVGDPGNELVFNPSGVYTGSGAAANTVYIETKNPGGGLQSGVPFHLAAVCPSTAKTRFSVVNSAGLENRASVRTGAYKVSTGKYVIAVDQVITKCATVVTRGSIDKAVPFTPATVEILTGPATNTVGVEVRNLLFFGGALINQAFQAATLCS